MTEPEQPLNPDHAHLEAHIRPAALEVFTVLADESEPWPSVADAWARLVQRLEDDRQLVFALWTLTRATIELKTSVTGPLCGDPSHGEGEHPPALLFARRATSGGGGFEQLDPADVDPVTLAVGRWLAAGFGNDLATAVAVYQAIPAGDPDGPVARWVSSLLSNLRRLAGPAMTRAVARDWDGDTP